MTLDVRLLFCHLICLASLCQAANAETLLRWRFTEGDSWLITVDQHTTTATSGAGKPSEVDVAMQMRLSWGINSVDSEGTAQITQKIERFAVAMKSGAAEPIKYASDSDFKPSGSAASIAAAVSPVIGAEFTVTMTNRGVIREVNLSEAAVEAFSAIESPGLKNLFSAEGVRQLFSQAAVELPEAAVVTGSNWTASSATASPLGTLKHDRTYTVAANEVVDGKTLERIELSGDLAVESSEQTAGKSKLVDQALSGKMLFDTEAGRLVTCQSTQAFTTERPYREFKIKVVTTAETKMTISPQ